MKVRPADRRDAAAMAAIERRRDGASGWSQAQFAGEIDRNDSIVVIVEADGEAAGHACVRLELDEAHLLTIAVAPRIARTGAGARLLQAAAEKARRQGSGKMTLEAASDNAAALGLYAKAGFREVGRRKGFYGPGRDAVLMDLPL